MKVLIFNDEKYIADQVVKTDTDIVGYTSGNVVFQFKNVSDFSKFEIKNGDFDVGVPTEVERITELENIILTLLEVL